MLHANLRSDFKDFRPPIFQSFEYNIFVMRTRIRVNFSMSWFVINTNDRILSKLVIQRQNVCWFDMKSWWISVGKATIHGSRCELHCRYPINQSRMSRVLVSIQISDKCIWKHQISGCYVVSCPSPGTPLPSANTKRHSSICKWIILKWLPWQYVVVLAYLRLEEVWWIKWRKCPQESSSWLWNVSPPFCWSNGISCSTNHNMQTK